MHSLRLTTAALSPNTFTVAPTSIIGLWLFSAFIRTTDVSKVFRVEWFAQVQDRSGTRRRDPDGHPSLLMSPHGAGGDTWALESVRLHMDLPRQAYLLVGWTP